MIAKKHLETGDHLVLDNASVHVGADTVDMIDALCKAAGIRIVFLPTYSPELDPCELVFGWVKNKMRNTYFPSRSAFWLKIIKTLAQVKPSMVKSFYDHSLQGWMKNR